MSRTILLVDDDRRLRDLLKDYLNEKNLKVFTCKDLIEADKVKLIVIPPIDAVNYGRTVGYDIIEHLPTNDIKQITATKIRKKLKL